MSIRFDHFSKVIRGAGKGKVVLGSEGMNSLSTMESLFIARDLRFRNSYSWRLR